MGNTVTRTLFLSDLRLDVHTDCKTIGLHLDRQWQLANRPMVRTTRTHVVNVHHACIELDGETVWPLEAEERADAFELWLYRMLMQDHAGRFGIFHASAVADGETTWVFCGPSGAGKSTLALAATRRGMRYITDEFVVTDGQRLWGWPRQLRFDPPADRASTPSWLANLPFEETEVPNGTPGARFVPNQSIRSASEAKSANMLQFVILERGSVTRATRLSALDALRCWHEAAFFDPPKQLGAACGVERCWRAMWHTPDALLNLVHRNMERPAQQPVEAFR